MKKKCLRFCAGLCRLTVVVMTAVCLVSCSSTAVTPPMSSTSEAVAAACPETPERAQTSEPQDVDSMDVIKDTADINKTYIPDFWDADDVPPEDILRRMGANHAIGEFDLTGLSFAERCCLLMQKRLETYNGWFIGAVGLLDVTLDGYPELVLIDPWSSPTPQECDFYDISGDKPVLVISFEAGDDVEHRRPWNCHNGNILQDELWKFYSTVFPDGTFGGIIETAGRAYAHDTFFFTFDGGEYPLENCLVSCDYIVRNAATSLYIHYTLYRFNAAEQKTGETLVGIDDALIWNFWTIPEEDYENLRQHHPDSWTNEALSVEEFSASIQDTWLGALRSLPRDPWQSPDVRLSFHRQVSGWSEVVQKAQELVEEYNRQLEEGDYDLPFVS